MQRVLYTGCRTAAPAAVLRSLLAAPSHDKADLVLHTASAELTNRLFIGHEHFAQTANEMPLYLSGKG